MKHLSLLIICLFAQLVLAQSGLDLSVVKTSQASNQLIFDVSLDAAQLAELDWSTGSVVDPQIKEGTPILKKGAPQMYKLTGNVMTKGMQSFVIKVISHESVDIPNVDILPSKGILYRDTDPSTVPLEYGPEYNNIGFYPAAPAALSEVYVQQGVTGQRLYVQPVQYDAVNKVLRIHTHFTVELTDNQVPIAGQTISKGQREILERRFLNFDTQDNRYDEVVESGELLVITDPTYASTIQDLVDWKIERGIRTTVVSVDEAGSTPEAIKAYIQDLYINQNLTYVLLVGDENAVPTMQTSSNNACDHCYSYVDGDDHYADLFVGRLNGENEGEIRTMVDRTLEYEKNPNTSVDWMSKGIGLGSNEGPGDDGEYDYEHLNNIKIGLLEYSYTEVFECYQGSNSADSPTPNEPSADLNGGPTTASIIEHIDNGISILNYTGHGGHSGLSTGGYDIAAVNNQENNGKYPFLIAVACCVGDFQNDFGAGPCLGDAWVRATDNNTGLPTGGIGGLFSSILQSWAPPMEGQDEMNLILTEQAQYPTRHTIGGVSLMGMASMIDEYDGGGISMADTWNIFGDPTVVLRTAMPAALTLNHAPFIPLGTTTLTVACDVEGAMVAASYDGQVLGVGYVENGLLELPLENIPGPITFKLTGTAFNHIPYQSDVEVTIDAGIYMLANLNDVNDSATGNANGLADYTENVSVHVNFANVGLEDATNLTATVSTTSTDVTLTSTLIENIPDIIQGADAIVEDAFSFVVNEAIVDGTSVVFQIEITDGVELWNSAVSIMLHAPILEVSPFFEFDDQQGAIPNNRLDAGETAKIRLYVNNVGSADINDVLHQLSVDDSAITIDQDSYTTGTIVDGDVALLQFDITASQDIPLNHKVYFDFETASGSYGDAFDFDLDVNLNIEDFEDLAYLADPQYDGIQPWFLDLNESNTGIVSMRSGLIYDNEHSDMFMEVDVEEAGQVTFAAKVSTEGSYDFLYFYIDGVEMGAWSGEIPWTDYTFDLNEGVHELYWSYVKDFSVSQGEDACWVDDIVLPQLVDPTSAETVTTTTSIQVFPNPTKGLFTLKAESGYRIELKDLMGRIVLSQQSVEGAQLIDASAYKPGIYILQVSNDLEEFNQKIIIQ